MSTLFFAHANGFPSPSYTPFFDALSQQGHHIDFIEKIGHNPKYPVTNNWSYLVDELEHEITSRHQAPIVGIGHSAGGLLSYLLARKRPDLYSHLILLDPPAINGWHNSLWWLSKRFGISDHLTPAAASKKRRTHFESRQHAYNNLRTKSLFKDFTDASFNAYIDHALRPEADGRVTLSFTLETELAIFRTAPDNLWKYCKPLPIAGLYLTGEDSDFAKLPFAQRLARKTGMDYQVLSGGHLFPQEHPETTAQIISQWLADH